MSFIFIQKKIKKSRLSRKKSRSSHCKVTNPTLRTLSEAVFRQRPYKACVVEKNDPSNRAKCSNGANFQSDSRDPSWENRDLGTRASATVAAK